MKVLRKENRQNIVHTEKIPDQKAIYGEYKDLTPILQNYLNDNNIRLYTHQTSTLEKVREGENIILTTRTASGKTLAFNLPVLETLINDKNATALYIYPTKALTNDQLKTLDELDNNLNLKIYPAVYDGDTPQSSKVKIRNKSRIILTNPYEVHAILGWHNKWVNFYSNLKYIIIDEAHMYRGVFGSNVSMVIRRMQRILTFYDSDPQFILSSATIANPIEFAEKLTDRLMININEDGSPHGKKDFNLLNPNMIDFKSTHIISMEIFVDYVKNNIQTLCFSVSRKMAELYIKWARKELNKGHADRVMTYRAGYLPKERREIEQGIKSGKYIGICSTNALEVGIDIGNLDCIIIAGYPGTIASIWQQAGRAGRKLNNATIYFVAFDGPIDQFFMNNPSIFFGKSEEHAIITLDNNIILLGHLLCASSELPIKEDEPILSIPKVKELLDELIIQSHIRKTRRGYVYQSVGSPIDKVNISNMGSEDVAIIENNKLLENISIQQAYSEAHTHAVFIHRGETYFVEELKLKDNIAKVRRKELDYYTKPVIETTIEVIEVNEKRQILNMEIFSGDFMISDMYIAYRRLKFEKVIADIPMNMPPLVYYTTGIGIIFGENNIFNDKKHYFNSIHAIEHILRYMASFLLMCDYRDIYTAFIIHEGLPSIFVYDQFEGGIGLSESLKNKIDKLFNLILLHLKRCTCQDGCPSCIFAIDCRKGTDTLSKSGAIILIEKMN